MALHDVVVVQVDRRGEAGHDVLREILRYAEHGLELARLHDAREDGAGVDVLAELERRIAEDLELAGFGRHDLHRRDAALLLVENGAQALDLLVLQVDLLLFGALHVVEPLLLDVHALLVLGDRVVRPGDVIGGRQLLLGERIVDRRLANGVVVLRARARDRALLPQNLLVQMSS